MPATDIPEITLQQGTMITVTTNTDAINGDVSGVAQLISDPGTDGIALREAIEATNNDPGEYTLNFSPALTATTIYTGRKGNDQDLPQLLEYSLIINGDIDGDQAPDSTIAIVRNIVITACLAHKLPKLAAQYPPVFVYFHLLRAYEAVLIVFLVSPIDTSRSLVVLS